MASSSGSSATSVLGDLGKYYEVTRQEDNGNIKANCKLCPPGKELSGNIKAKGNFLLHLKRKHKHARHDYDEAKKAKKDTQSIDRFVPKTPMIMKKCNQEDASKLITNLIVKCALPLSLVEKDPFKDLVKKLSSGNCHSIARNTLVSKIDKLSSDHYEHIKTELKSVNFVCSTADIWSTKNNKRSFLGMTVHYIDPVDYQRKSYAIACDRFKGSHEHVVIAEKLQEIHNKYDLPAKKIVRTITDNAANFCAAFERFGMTEALTEEGDVIDLQETDMDVTFGHLYNYDDDNEQLDDDILDENDQEDHDDEDDNGPRYELPKHERCLSHTLNLIAMDIGKVKHGKKSVHHLAMGRVTGLWNKLHKSQLSAEIIIEHFGRSLPTPVVTRWNSLYDALKFLLGHEKEFINEALIKVDLPTLETAHYEYLKEYEKVLKPLSIALDKLQGERDVYYGEIIPILAKLDYDLKNIRRGDLNHAGPILSAVQNGLEKRLQHFLLQDENVPFIDVDNIQRMRSNTKKQELAKKLAFKRREMLANTTKDALIATGCHPAFKLKPIMKEKRDNVKELIKEEALKVSAKTNDDNVQEEIVKDDYYSDIWSDDENDDDDNAQKNAIDIEIAQFLNDKDASLKMLDKYPRLKIIFLKYNTPLTSSAPVERLFSFGGIIIGGRRGSLTDKNFEKLCLMNANSSKFQ